MQNMGLFDEFKKSSKNEWEEKILKDLKGKPLSSIVWDSAIGKINPVIFDYNNDYETPISNKNQNSWNIAQVVDASSPNANQMALQSLKEGGNYLVISNCSPSTDFASLLKDIQTDIIHTALILPEKKALDTFISFSECITSTTSFSLFYDPIGNAFIQGKHFSSENEIENVVKKLSTFPNGRLNPVNGSIYSNSGATVDKQIGLILAHLNEYLHLAEQKNFLSEFSKNLELTLGIGTSYFLEIAKIRALKNVLASLLEVYNCKHHPKLFAETSTLYFSKKDSYSNLLRSTTQAMSALASGCDTLLVFPYDLKFSENFSKRIAQNIQLILQEEGHFNKVIDPAKGSYYIEQITDSLIEKGWSYFQFIESQEGILKAFENETIQKAIEEDKSQLISELIEGTKIMIGVNKFTLPDDNLIPATNKTTSTDTDFKPLQLIRLSESFEQTIKTTENA